MGRTPSIDKLPTVEAAAARPADRSVRVGSLLTGLFGLLAFQQLLLWRFVDFAPWWLYAIAGSILIGALICLGQSVRAGPSPTVPLANLAGCAAIAFAMCLLGGEGGFFYQNVDWQLRNAQLFDIVRYDWPYAYSAGGVKQLQRTQIAMFLIPGLVGKMLGRQAADIALLLQNSAMLALVLASVSVLFTSVRARAVAAVVIVSFSGMDYLGQEFMIWNWPDWPRKDHLEHWILEVLYQSNVSQIFWAPHHSIVGWLGAGLYLLWKTEHVRVGTLLAFVPLFLIWSPLAVMGLTPFLAHAGAASLRARKFGWRDLAAPALTSLVSLPGLIYLAAGSVALGIKTFFLSQQRYLTFEIFEVLPFLVAAFLLAVRSRFGGGTLLVVAGTLLLIPHFQIGQNADFQMRASIPALFVLAVITVDALMIAFAKGSSAFAKLVGAGLSVVLAIGSITGWHEVRRAVVNARSPLTECGVHNAWRQDAFAFPDEQIRLYVAPLSAFPAWMRPAAPTIVPVRPERCWDRPWPYRGF